MSPLFKYFNFDDFDCSHCGKNWTDIKLLQKLDLVREEYGKPITITSGYRCPEHNKAVGGVPNSQHVSGKAADISGASLDDLYDICLKHFKAVGDGRRKGFIHVDLRDDTDRRWVY